MHAVLFVLLAASQGVHANDDLARFTTALSRGDCGEVNRIVSASRRKPLLQGIQLEIGACGPKEETAALARYREAAVAKDNDGRYSFFVLVGRWGAENRNVPKELWQEALGYLTAAGNAGHPSACSALADMYHYGFEGKKDTKLSAQYRACAR